MPGEGPDLLGFQREPPQPGPSIQIPRAPLSPSEIAGPYEALSRGLDELGGGLDKLGAGIDKMAVPMAERQAAEDLNKQKVTRDANGNIQILNPANSPLMFGEAGEVYRRAIRAGTVAAAGNVMSQAFTEAHQKYPLDPAGFKANTDAMLDKLQQDYGGSITGQAMLQHGRSLQTEHFDHITNSAAANDLVNSRTALESSIESNRDTLIGLARQNGVDSPEFKKSWDNYVDAQNALAANPLYKKPQELIDNEIKQTYNLMQGEALVEHVDQTYDKSGKAAAQKVLEDQVLKNPDLKESDRSRLYSQGMARLAFRSADQKAEQEADRQSLGYLRKGLAEGTIQPGDAVVSAARQRFQKNGSADSVSQLDAIVQVYGYHKTLGSLPDGQRGPTLAAAGMPASLADVPEQYRGMVSAAAQESGVDPTILARQLWQENKFKASGTSPAGAQGIAQFIPSTAARFGVDVNSPESSIRGQGQYMHLLMNKFGGNVGLALAGYNWGEGNLKQWIAAGANPAKMPKETRDYVLAITGHEIGDWQKSPIQPLPEGSSQSIARSADGGPNFTADQLAANPFLLDEVIRAQAADVEDKSAHLGQVVEAMKETIKGGNVPDQAALDMVIQAGQRDPGKYGMLANEAAGIRAAAVPLAGGGGGPTAPMAAPDRQNYENYLRGLAAQPDLYHQRLANTALELMRAQDERAKEAPLATYAQRFGLPAPPPIDAGSPDSIGRAIQIRAHLADDIAVRSRSAAPPLLDKGEGAQLSAALQGQQGAAVMGQLTNLKTEDMVRLTNSPEFVADLKSMMKSADPTGQKQTASFNFQDRWQQNNWKDFTVKMGEAGSRDLDWFKNEGRGSTGEEIRDKLANPPQPLPKELEKAVDKHLEGVTADKIVANFKPTFWDTFTAGPGQERTANAPGTFSEQIRLKRDYDAAFRTGFSRSGDLDAAGRYASEQLSKKWSPSALNGGEVMRFSPEAWYRAANGKPLTVGGSMDWMRDQLDQDIKGALGLPAGLVKGESMAEAKLGHPMTEADQAAIQKYYGGARLVSDDSTEREALAGRYPSYLSQVQGKYGPELLMDRTTGVALRERFDPSQYIDRTVRNMNIGGRIGPEPPVPGALEGPPPLGSLPPLQ
jgi:soluble lytic murein transglycosylase-like protein